MLKSITGKTGIMLVWLWAVFCAPLFAEKAAPAAPGKDAVSQSYANAYNFVLDGKWNDAIKALSAHLKNYPSSSTANDANFWLCFSQSKAEKPEEACECYADFVAKYQKGNYVDKAKENLVTISHQLSMQGKPECEVRVKTVIRTSKDENEDIKIMVLHQLLQSGDEKALQMIFKLYDQSGESSREKILYVFTDSESPQVTVKLGEIVQKDPSIEIRKKAVYALADRGKVAVTALKDVLASKNDVEVRKAALFALADTGDPSALPALGEVAANETNEELAKAATFAIGNVEGPASTEALQKVLKSGKSVEVRKAALFALSDHSSDDSTVAILKGVALGDGDRELRKAAVFAIANNHSDTAAKALREIVTSSTDQEVQNATLFAMADHGGPEAQPVLANIAINGSDPELAKNAVHALVDLTHDDMSQLLEVFQKSKYEEVKKAALYAIGDSHSKSAIDALSKILAQDQNEEFRRAAVYALGNAGKDNVVPILLNTAKKDASMRVRTAAVQVLGDIGTPAAKDALMKILEDKE